MDKPLYWKEVNEPFCYNNPITGKEVKGTIGRRIYSNHPLVDQAWITVEESVTNKGPVFRLNIVAGMKLEPTLNPVQPDINGYPTNTNIKRFCQIITPEQKESLDIPEAIEFIQSLPIN